VLIIRRSKLHYTASGIITPIGGRLVHRLREDERERERDDLGVRAVNRPQLIFPCRSLSHCRIIGL